MAAVLLAGLRLLVGGGRKNGPDKLGRVRFIYYLRLLG